MKELNSRINCADGVSLSVQANKYAYCSPRIDEAGEWRNYSSVEVGYIEDSQGNKVTPPDSWLTYAEMGFSPDIYGYVPIDLVESFINDHGGEK